MKAKKNSRRQFVVDETGKKISVVLPLQEYENLLEDISDLAAVAERREEPTTAHSGVVARLKGDGLL